MSMSDLPLFHLPLAPEAVPKLAGLLVTGMLVQRSLQTVQRGRLLLLSQAHEGEVIVDGRRAPARFAGLHQVGPRLLVPSLAVVDEGPAEQGRRQGRVQ